MSNILAVDPGRQKCGMAIVDADGAVVCREVIATDKLLEVATLWLEQYGFEVIVLGDRTASKQFRQILQSFNLNLEMVDENYSSVEGRQIYLREHAVGWRKLIPLGLQKPSRPFDDYVAVVLAKRYLAGNSRKTED